MGYFSISSLLSSSPGLLDAAKVAGVSLLYLAFQLPFNKTYLAFSPRNLFLDLNIKSLCLLLLVGSSALLFASSAVSSSVSYQEGWYMTEHARIIPRPISMYAPETQEQLTIAVLIDQLGLYLYTSALFLSLALWRPAAFFLLQEDSARAKGIMSARESSTFKWYAVIRLIVLGCLRLGLHFGTSEMSVFSPADNLIALFLGAELVVVLVYSAIVYRRLRAIQRQDVDERKSFCSDLGTQPFSPCQQQDPVIYHPLLYYYLDCIWILLICLSFQLSIFIVRMIFQFGKITNEAQLGSDIVTLIQNASFGAAVITITSILIIPSSYRMVMGIDDEFYFFEHWRWSWKRQLRNLRRLEEESRPVSPASPHHHKMSITMPSSSSSSSSYSRATVFEWDRDTLDFDFFLSKKRASQHSTFRLTSGSRRRSSARPLMSDYHRRPSSHRSSSPSSPNFDFSFSENRS